MDALAVVGFDDGGVVRVNDDSEDDDVAESRRKKMEIVQCRI